MALDAGVLPNILQCLRSFESDESVQCFGFSALANICGDSPKAKHMAVEGGKPFSTETDCLYSFAGQVVASS